MSQPTSSPGAPVTGGTAGAAACRDCPNQEVGARCRHAALPRQVRGLRVLVIDAEPLVRWCASVALSQAGCVVIAARDFADGQASPQGGAPFDVVLVDAQAHGESGSQLVAGIAQSWPQARVILMHTAPDRLEALGLDALPCLAKPFDLQDLLLLVEEAAR